MAELKKGAFVSAFANGIINAVINWFTVRGNESLLLTDDLISSGQHTVFAGAVPLAVSLAFILTTITYFTTKSPGKPPYFPKVFLLALKHSFFAFGIVVAVAIVIQRFFGAITVSPVQSALLAGFIAALVGGVVTFLTSKEITSSAESD